MFNLFKKKNIYKKEEIEKAIFDAFRTGESYQTTIDWNDALIYAKTLRPDFTVNDGFDVIIDGETVYVRFLPHQKEGTLIIMAATHEQAQQDLEDMLNGTFEI